MVIVGAALPVFIILGAGYLLRRGRVLTGDADASLMKLVFRVLYPCLYFDYVVGNPSLSDPRNLVAAPLVGFLTVTGGFLVANIYGRLAGLKVGKGLRTFAFGNGIYNYGFIPIPLIMVLFGDRGTLGVLLVHNVGIELAIWTVGIVFLSGKPSGGALKNLFNPPVVALLLSLAINAAGLDARIPAWLGTTVSMLAQCCVPVGILLAGALIADLLRDQKLLAAPRIITGALAVRVALLPAAFLLLVAFLPGLTSELRQVIVIQAAMPAGIMPIVLARHYGGDTAVAIRIVLATTIASLVTMPLWIGVGLRLL